MKWSWLLVIGGVVILAGVGWRQKILGARDRGVELVVVGDVMLGRSVNTGMIRRNDFSWPFEKTKTELKQADLTIGNLEAPLTEECRPMDTGMVFCGEAKAVEGLVAAGFDGVNVANNHSWNYGEGGMKETEEGLTKAGIAVVGEDRVWIEEVKNLKLAFLGFDDVSGRVDEATVRKKIKEAKEASDLVIVNFHWGNEYTGQPTERQKSLARLAVTAGATVVVGHHPHWVQPIEEYKTGVIAYSLGNFVFDQMWSEKTREGLAVKFYLTKDGVRDYETKKVRIYEYGQPRWED